LTIQKDTPFLASFFVGIADGKFVMDGTSDIIEGGSDGKSVLEGISDRDSISDSYRSNNGD
jgi:hypothetical protein